MALRLRIYWKELSYRPGRLPMEAHLRNITFAPLLMAAAILYTPSSITVAEQKELAQGRIAKPNPIFNDAVAVLHQETVVPLRLPEYVPYSDDKQTPLYAIVDVAESDRYSIELAWLKDCAGGNSCHVGYIGGSKTAFAPDGKPTAPVMLNGGIQGLFTNFVCGAHCDDAAIDWSQQGYHYGISLKVADKETLVRMANSAIGRRPEKGRE